MALDIDLPGRPGMELLPQIKRDFPDTEVIFMTGSPDTKLAVHALRLGASGYVSKPADREEVVSQVRHSLERRQRSLDKRSYTQDLERQVFEQTATIRRTHEQTIHRLVAAASYRDEETGAHIKRTGLLSELIARKRGWDTRRADHLRMAAPMHDVGKIAIPDRILRKPGKLTADEFEIMKAHTLIGAQLLANSDSLLLRMAEEIARCHHERLERHWLSDATQRPQHSGKCGIVTIVDVYDALMHDRVYRPAWPEEKVLEMMREERGQHFDPALLDTFFSLLPEMRSVLQEHPDESQEDPIDQDATALLARANELGNASPVSLAWGWKCQPCLRASHCQSLVSLFGFLSSIDGRSSAESRGSRRSQKKNSRTNHRSQTPTSDPTYSYFPSILRANCPLTHDRRQARQLGRELHIHRVTGDPGPAIIQLARTERYDCIVVAMSEDRKLHAGWADYVLDLAHCQVLLAAEPLVPKLLVED